MPITIATVERLIRDAVSDEASAKSLVIEARKASGDELEALYRRIRMVHAAGGFQHKVSDIRGRK